MKKNIVRLIKIGLVILIIAMGISLIKCEINTKLYGDAFTYEYRQTNMLHDGQTCKVLDFKEEWAKVYYYCEHGGDVITFVLDDNKWIMEEWNTVWSSSGSADGIQWPYIWHNLSP